MSDVEDPDLYAAEPLYNWEHSEKGQFVMKNALDTPEWHRTLDPNRYGWQFSIVAQLEGPALTEYLLRWGQ
jgi:hypothetical protein